LEGQDDGALEEIVMLLCDLQEGSDGESQSSLERREEGEGGEDLVRDKEELRHIEN
jgi:hypothetical protein